MGFYSAGPGRGGKIIWFKKGRIIRHISFCMKDCVTQWVVVCVGVTQLRGLGGARRLSHVLECVSVCVCV